MRKTEAVVRQIVSTMVDRLAGSGHLAVTGSRPTLERRLTEVLLSNFREEAEIDHQARLKADEIERLHSREVVGMSQQKIIALVRERLAKEKGFIL